MSWLNDVLKCTKEFESPERFFWWSGISAISAVCRRNIYLERYAYKLYPNTYVLLIGPSGLKKSIPIGMAEKLVKMVDSTRVYSGRGSIQGIIRDLGKVYTNKKKQAVTDAKCFVVSGEFDAMLVNDEHAYSIITDLYDTHWKDDWRNIIKTSGTDELKNIYMTILGASNEDNLELALPQTAERGGFVARTSIVLEETTKCTNPLTEKPAIVPNYTELSSRLLQITNLSGEFTWSEEAKKFYEPWYAEISMISHTDRTGTLNRLGDTVLKVAMCVSLSKRDDLILLKEDIEEAANKCMECVPDMRRVFLGSGKHVTADIMRRTLKLLLDRKEHKITRRNLLSLLYGIADAIDLDRVIDTFVQAGTIESVREGGEIVYILNKEVVQQYRNIRSRITQ